MEMKANVYYEDEIAGCVSMGALKPASNVRVKTSQ